jgi:hypothetical protein
VAVTLTCLALLAGRGSDPPHDRTAAAASAHVAGAGARPLIGAAADWRLDNLVSIGGHPVTTLGSPAVVATPAGPAVEFDGVADGLLLDTNPLAGLARFTVEVLFQPAPGGPPEQRFLHVEEPGGARRALIETRLLPGGAWCLDTFLKDGDASLTLIDRTRTHPVGAWAVAALVYDGREMAHFVDGTRDAAGPVAFRPLGPGRTSIGVRLNRVSWFKGRIARVRVTPAVLAPEQFLARPGLDDAPRHP